MILNLKHRNHTPSSSFTALVETELQSLRSVLRIDEARVVVEHQRESSPPFRISAHLVTPGPDVCADATDHTLRAALTKLVRGIRGQIKHRMSRHSRKLRSKVSVRTAPTPA